MRDRGDYPLVLGDPYSRFFVWGGDRGKFNSWHDLPSIHPPCPNINTALTTYYSLKTSDGFAVGALSSVSAKAKGGSEPNLTHAVECRNSAPTMRADSIGLRKLRADLLAIRSEVQNLSEPMALPWKGSGSSEPTN